MWRGNTRRSPLILFWTASSVDYWIFDNNIYMMITVFALSSMSFMCFARDISQLSIARCTADGFVDESPSWFCGSHAPFEGKSWRKLRHCPSLPNYLNYNGCNVNNDTLHYSNGFLCTWPPFILAFHLTSPQWSLLVIIQWVLWCCIIGDEGVYA